MRPARILVVDDNMTNNTLAEFVLLHAKFDVTCVSSAQAAVESIDAGSPDLILMDVQMPGMSGLALTQHLKSDPRTRDIPIVAFTAFAMKGDEERILEAGCDGYISKPITVATFADEVRAMLRPSSA